MKFHIELVVDIPFARLIELFEDPNNLKKWQPNVISFKHLTGEIGQPGATSRIRYNLVVKTIDIKETILKRNLPEEFVLRHETEGVANIISNNFKEIAPNKTRWIMENNFQFSGLKKFAALALKGVFKKQTELTMERFKKFAEQVAKEEQV